MIDLSKYVVESILDDDDDMTQKSTTLFKDTKHHLKVTSDKMMFDLFNEAFDELSDMIEHFVDPDIDTLIKYLSTRGHKVSDIRQYGGNLVNIVLKDYPWVSFIIKHHENKRGKLRVDDSCGFQIAEADDARGFDFQVLTSYAYLSQDNVTVRYNNLIKKLKNKKKFAGNIYFQNFFITPEDDASAWSTLM